MKDEDNFENFSVNMSKQKIDDYERRARVTGNLLYVWMAIHEAHAAGIPMPDWCYGQIAAWATDLYELAHLLDPSNTIRRRNDGETDFAFAERVHARWSKPELSPNEALDKAEAIFKFSARAWNAFRAVIIDEDALARSRKEESRKLSPPSKKRATAPNESEARMARRRKQKARELQQPQKIKS
jgi:phage terminase large subunit GpA-like protein